jgi:hypothetical protein
MFRYKVECKDVQSGFVGSWAYDIETNEKKSPVFRDLCELFAWANQTGTTLVNQLGRTVDVKGW